MYQARIAGTVTRSGRESRHGEVERKSVVRATSYRQRAVVALVQGRLARARISAALDPNTSVTFVDTLDDLRATVRGTRCSLTVVTEARDAMGRPTTPFLRELAVQSPAVATIGYSTTERSSRDLLDLAMAGIDELIQEDVDDVGLALKAAYAGSTESCAARAVRRALEGTLAPDLRPMADYCLQFPRDDHTVEGLARAMGVDRKTLLNQCDRNGFPPPSAMAMWCRLLLAAALLEATGASVEHVAIQLDFASPSAFRNACRRYTGEKPSSWRKAGGLSRVAEMLKRSVHGDAGAA